MFDLVLAACVLVPAAMLAFAPRWYVVYARRSFARTARAYVDGSLAGAIDRSIRRELKLSSATLVLMSAVFAVGRRVGLGPVTEVAPCIALFAAWAAAIALTRLRSAGRELAVPTSTTTLARSRRTVVSDYVGPLELTMVGGGLTLFAGLIAAAVVGWHRGDMPGSVAVVALVDGGVVLVLVGCIAWITRAICARPTPAVDASHLYLQDAWRARTVGQAFFGVVSTTSLSGVILLLQGGHSIGLSLSVEQLLLVTFYALQGTFLLLQHRRFRRRLWRTLQRGQMLLPGQVVPSAMPGTRAVA